MPPPLLATLDGAGRLEPVRLGVRFATNANQGSDAAATGPRGGLEWAPFAVGRQRIGPFLLGVALDHRVDGARCDLVVRNVTPQPIQLDAAVVGLRWTGFGASPLRFLRHGWQSWSFTGSRPLDEQGDPGFPSGPWLRGLHHALGEVPADRAGWHESHLVTVVAQSPAGPACVVGVLERGEAFGLVYLRPTGGGIDIEVELRLEIELAPGKELDLEPVHLELGHEANALLESYAERLGEHADARTGAAFQAGWCSWYHFFHGVTEEALRRNLEALAEAREELPVDVVQLDDGYQRAIGDWIETNDKFPSGLVALAAEIRDAGFTPGLWTAPFCVVPESRLFRAHPEWLLRHGEELHRALIHGQWTRDGWVYALDPSRDEVVEHLTRTFSALVVMGFPYLKLDFLYAVAMQADAHDPRLSRAQRLRRGLQAIRRGAGSDAFLLGCGCPLGPAIGIVDGMRIGPDVAPRWDVADPRIPGLEATEPSTRNAVRNVLTRAWMHRRLWLNDPDCLMARLAETELSPDEARTLAAVVAASGGLAIFSDDVPRLGAESRALVRETLALAREVDAAGAVGTARAIDLLAEGMPAGMVARVRGGGVAALVNASESAELRCADLGALGLPRPSSPPQPQLGTSKPGHVEGTRVEVELPAHGSSLLRIAAAPSLAVFCDFDGTFAIQDVGATLARRHAGDRRRALGSRLARGELTAWEFNLELLDGLPLPEADLEAFLQTVELSPGAHELVAWCVEHEVPFRVLSDGFDYNLDRLQEIHGIRFAYDANHLRYQGGTWRIQAAHPNPSCECGTGTCKRARIEAFRAEHPEARVVHIGNGRVSDLCAVAVADVVFAKDTLADELTRRGVAFEPFETLRDVLPALERLRQSL